MMQYSGKLLNYYCSSHVLKKSYAWCVDACQDSKNRITHHMTNRLGSVCGKNAARDWWRCMKDGPVTGIY